MTAQQVVLSPYDFDSFIKTSEEDRTTKNPVYQYITENYNVVSEKELVLSSDGGDCGFTQLFEQGIVYTKRNCGDATLAAGEVLTIPNPDRESILVWAESINKIFGDHKQNLWNFDLTEYRPMDGFQGAFFNIIRDKDCTTILVMSGC